jgi:lysophospholipase L1-like esterase
VRRTSSIRHLLTVPIVTLCLVAASHSATAGDTLTIMPLGDSITEGWMASMIGHPEADVAGYRGPLYAKLKAAGYNVQFVGSNDTFPGTLPAAQIRHEGHSGWMISPGMAGKDQRDGLTNHIDTWLGPNGAEPNIILLMIGANDIWWNNQLATAPDRLSALISRISNKTTGLKPNAKLIVAQVTPFNDDGQDGLAQAYNLGVANVVASHRALGENVSLVDMHAALSHATDLSDLVHPNASGYDKIADVWFQGIKAIAEAKP